jgi:DNA-binding NarL/FixJ family response regulator
MLEPQTERGPLEAPVDHRAFTGAFRGRRGDDGAVRGSVLVVDDDAAFRGLAQRVLAGFDLAVIGEAGTVAAALVAAARLRPTAVLVDVGLPDGDGVALARELVALPWHPRVVLTSSDAGAAGAQDVARSGAAAFVPKDQLPNTALDRLLGHSA